ncbi:hydratase [Nesidiocoris tenuis]|uniref:Enoyl-CoA hydratase domain-containing protein 3, mitochondrial n=1 Tax=Nesidiocoris tenuis TaxID=355587 RepID=A0ABN7ASM8_9HEMI|nr:hydratase [Nesidiocoris tenuis]
MLSCVMKPQICIHMVLRRCYSDVVRVAEVDGIRKITMIDDKTRNSMTIKMTQNLLKAVTENVDGPELRAIVISSGGRMFSSGHNLKDLASSDGRKVFALYSELMVAMQACPVPVITAIDGAAVAAGAQLVAQSDIAIASNESTFATPGANFGVFCHTPGIPIARSTHRKTAAYMLLTGLPLTAQEAVERGLVSRVVRKDELEKEVAAVCDAIKAKSKAVVSLGKAFFYKQLELDTGSAYKEGAKVMSDSLDLPDGIEGLKSFAEKRKPTWKHKA